MSNNDNSKKPETPSTAGKSLSPAEKSNPDKESTNQTANASAKSASADKTTTEASTAENQSKETQPSSSQKTANKEKPKTAKKTAASHGRKTARPFPITATLALFIGLSVGAASYVNYTRWQVSDLQTQTLNNENTNLRSQLDQLQQQIDGLQRQDLDMNLRAESLQSDQKLQHDSITQLSQQLQALSADQGKDPLLWRLAEVEYLLSVANHRLILERDVDTALVVLRDADKRIEAIGDPALIPVRKIIAGEITALNSVQQPDITGMALRLSSLVEGIESLPLVSGERPEVVETGETEVVSGISEFITKVLQDLKGVVTVRRSDQPIEPLLPPDEQYYLAQNLGLKLEESRIALLRRDTETFRQNLSDTRDWVQRYFDKDSSAVDNVVVTVNELENIELKPMLPDISGSLRELRHWMDLHKQQANSSANVDTVQSARHNKG